MSLGGLGGASDALSGLDPLLAVGNWNEPKTAYGKVKGKILAQNVVDPSNANFVVLHKGILVKDADVKRLQEGVHP